MCAIGVALVATAVDLITINTSNEIQATASRQPTFSQEQVDARNWIDQCIGQCHYGSFVNPIPGYTVGGSRPYTPNADAYAEAGASKGLAQIDMVVNFFAIGAAATRGFQLAGICSFSAETKVATLEGEENISEIQIGDYVLAWNEADDTVGFYKIIDVFSHEDEVITKLIIDGEWIETTPEHPFYTEEEGWLPAGEIETGMHIRQAKGDYKLVWLKWSVYKKQEMYNFTVNVAHTYFVGEGQWLVHNGCGPATTLVPGSYADESIPARGPERDWLTLETEEINRIGSTTGCHTCGTTNPGTTSGNFIPDHQPPSAINIDKLPQRLYPHCLSCSRRQGGEVLQFLRRLMK